MALAASFLSGWHNCCLSNLSLERFSSANLNINARILDAVMKTRYSNTGDTWNLLIKILIFNVIFVVYCASNTVMAATWQNLSEIEQAARQFMQNSAKQNALDMEFTIGRLDSRLHLAPCARPLEVSARSKIKPGAMSLQIECRDKQAWKIYLPLQVKLWRTVLAASRPLPRGHKIAADDVISLREAQISDNQARYMQDQLADLLGQVLGRAQASGRPFDARYVKPPLWVKRGQTVILLAETQSVQIRMKGNALADGAKGDLIKVRNLSSQRVVEGVVVKPGIILVRM